MRVSTVVILVLFAVRMPASQAPDPKLIIQHSVEANQRDWADAPNFNFLERKKTDDGTRTYQELMIEGSRYERLVAVNQHSLSPARESHQAQELRKVILTREKESPDQRRNRIAKFDAGRKRDHLLMQQMTKAFEFTLAGEKTIQGRRVYELHAVPQKDYQPPNRDAAVLTGMNGTLWIDKETYQWVKVEAHVVHPVSIMGFAARVEPGTEFELEKMPVTSTVWEPSHFAMKSRARIMFFFTHHQKDDETYFDYRPATSDLKPGSPGNEPGRSSSP